MAREVSRTDQQVDILAGYPSLTVEGIRAAAAYGAALAREELVLLRER